MIKIKRVVFVLYYAAGLVIWNFIVAAVYAVDKYRARRGGRRIAERTLLLCAFVLGGCGAIIGMRLFRHKTRKTTFNILVPLAVAVNAGTIFGLIVLL